MGNFSSRELEADTFVSLSFGAAMRRRRIALSFLPHAHTANAIIIAYLFAVRLTNLFLFSNVRFVSNRMTRGKVKAVFASFRM